MINGLNSTLTLTTLGRNKISKYILELSAKRTELLGANKDTADETELPTLEDIYDDMLIQGFDSDGEYVNSWGVTDNYNADSPICLKLGEDAVTGDDCSYIQKEFFGMPLLSTYIPYNKVVNNGYTILTASKELSQELSFNEVKRNGIIDWWLFKEGETILILPNGKCYGCTGFVYGVNVTLTQIK